MDAVRVLGAPDIVCVQRASFFPVPNSLDPGCPCGAGGHRGRRRGALVERVLVGAVDRVPVGTRRIAERGKAVVEIERGISHERRGGTRLRTEGSLELIASRTEHDGDCREGKQLLGGGYLADLRSSGTAACIGSPRTWCTFIPAKKAAGL